MKIYIIDVSDMKDCSDPDKLHPTDDGEEVLPEMIWLHKDLIRGCTDSFMTMKIYYEEMQQLVGKYVDLVVHEYEIITSYDLPPELRGIDIDEEKEMDNDTLSAIGLTLYNSHDRNIGCNRVYEAAHMPVLIQYPTEKGDIYVVNSAAQEIFDEIYFTECEYEIVLRIIKVFICLKDYLLPISTDDTLKDLFQLINSQFPEVLHDFYDINLRWHLDPIMVNKVYVDSLEMFRR